MVLLDWWETTLISVLENAVDCLKFGRLRARSIILHDGLIIPRLLCLAGYRNWVLRWVLSSKTLFAMPISFNRPFGALHTWTLLGTFRNHNGFWVLLAQTWILGTKVNQFLPMLLLFLNCLPLLLIHGLILFNFGNVGEHRLVFGIPPSCLTNRWFDVIILLLKFLHLLVHF